MSKKSLYILIVTYNAEKWVDEHWGALGVLPDGWKLVVVDNASADGTVAAVRRSFPHARLIGLESNLGFGRANNVGLRLALEENADFVFLLNQDATISTDALEELMRLAGEHPECLIMSPVHMNGSGDALDYAFDRVLNTANCPEFIPDCLNGVMKDVYHSSYGIAALWLLSRKCLETVGGFNPLFFHYGEDNDYVNRVLHHGFKAGVAVKVFARHDRVLKHRKKPLSDSFTDSLIRFANPSGRKPGRLAVLKAYSRPVLKACFKRDFGLAGFLVRSCRELLKGGERAAGARQTAERPGPAFLR